MRRLNGFCVLVLSCGLLVACNSSSSPVADRETDGDGPKVERTANRRRDAGPRSLPVSKEDGPDEVVRAFLDAARSGDDSTATQLLTDKAREETDREGLTLDPPGTPSMKYDIVKVDYHEQNPHAAYVTSSWVEQSSDPGASNDPIEVVWVLRRQSNGWRIAGMAAQMDPNEQHVWLNFEDPQHVARIKSEIAEEPGAETARRGEGEGGGEFR